MLEIIFLVMMCKNIGKLLRAKGRRPLGFQFLLIGMWFGGEIFGAVLGVIATAIIQGRNDGVGLLSYLFALACACLGAWFAFRIAKSAGSEADRRGFPVLPAQAQPLPPIQDPQN